MGSTGIITTHSDGSFLLSSETRSFSNISVDPKNPNKIPDFIAVADDTGKSAFALYFGKSTTRDQYDSLLRKWRGRMNVTERAARATYNKVIKQSQASGLSPAEAAAKARDARDKSTAKSFKDLAKTLGIKITLRNKALRR